MILSAKPCGDLRPLESLPTSIRIDQFGNCYTAFYRKQGNLFEITKETGGTATAQPLSTIIAATQDGSHVAVNGQTFVVVLAVSGNTITLTVDGVVVITKTDTTITAAGRPGLRASSNSLNFLLDNWEARQ